LDVAPGVLRRFLKGKCNVCGCNVKLSIGDMSPEEALNVMKDVQGFDCPGLGGLAPHIEIGKLSNYISFDDLEVHAEPMPDVEADTVKFVDELKNNYGELFTTNPNQYGDLAGLPSGIEHLGFGDFGNHEFIFHRHDAPNGMRFYTKCSRK
jgi:hypothetical protein